MGRTIEVDSEDELLLGFAYGLATRNISDEDPIFERMLMRKFARRFISKNLLPVLEVPVLDAEKKNGEKKSKVGKS